MIAVTSLMINIFSHQLLSMGTGESGLHTGLAVRLAMKVYENAQEIATTPVQNMAENRVLDWTP